MKKRSERDGVHAEGKSSHQWWATAEEWKGMLGAVKRSGYANYSAMLRAIATGGARVTALDSGDDA